MNLIKLSKSLQILLVICCFLPCIYNGCTVKTEEPFSPSDTLSLSDNEMQDTKPRLESNDQKSIGEQIIHYIQYPDTKSYSMIGYVVNEDDNLLISVYLILLSFAVYLRFFRRKVKLNLWFSFIMFIAIVASFLRLTTIPLSGFYYLVLCQFILMLVDWRLVFLEKKLAKQQKAATEEM
ncbi:MAG: hypothetical protein HYZ42_10190 [Bacteroidetes bacterium]|nr:hypothetical protein [Bacteroidota bacterium]